MTIQQIRKTMDLKPPITYLSTMAGLVAVSGTISNILSLSYFIHLRYVTTKSLASGNPSSRLTRNLFIALNSFDLTLCLFLFLCSIRGAVNNDEIILTFSQTELLVHRGPQTLYNQLHRSLKEFRYLNIHHLHVSFSDYRFYHVYFVCNPGN